MRVWESDAARVTMSEGIRRPHLLLLLVVLCTLTAGTAAGAGHGLDRDDRAGSPRVEDTADMRAIDGADRNLSSGKTYWQGQTIGFNDPNGTLETDRLHLREYDEEDDEPGRLVREFEVDDAVQIDTSELQGAYVLVSADRRTRSIVIDDGTVTGTADVEAAVPFEVLVQTLHVRLVGSGTDNGTVDTDLELDLTSNRARYNVNVTATNLTFDELESAFVGDRLLRDRNAPHADRPPIEGGVDGYEAYADAGVIVLRGSADGRLRSDFGDAESIPRAVTVEVSDTGVTDTAEISMIGVETGPFKITDITAPRSVSPGDPVTFYATVRNRWSATSEREVTFRLGGETRTAIEPSLPGEESTTLSTTLSAPSEPGEYKFVVDTDGDSANRTLTVIAPNGSEKGSVESTGEVPGGEQSSGDGENGTDESDDSSGDDDDSDDSGVIGGGPVAIDVDLRLGVGALLTLLSGAGVVVWRRR